MNSNIYNFEFVKDLAWPDVFEIWRRNEEGNADWEKHWRERGFDSWREWRERYVEPLGLAERGWKLCRVTEPEQTVPDWCGGPFKSWVDKYYGGRKAPTFGELVKHPELRGHEGLRRLMENFPANTIVTAVRTNDGPVIMEGMHRCCAVALAASEDRVITRGFFVALGESLPGDLEIVGGFKADK